jgi:hypothetical protein
MTTAAESFGHFGPFGRPVGDKRLLARHTSPRYRRQVATEYGTSTL